MTAPDIANERRDPDIADRRLDVRSFPTLHGAHDLLDEYLPRMASLLERPHVDRGAEWWKIRDELDAIFMEHGWDADESRVAFDLLVAMSERIEEERTDVERG